MRKPRILIAEDAAITAKNLQKIIESFGYETSGIVKTGEEAVEKALKDKPDIILMDVMLNGNYTGIDAAERIRAYSSVPIVFLTALSDDETFLNANKTNAGGYLIKPFDEKKLRIVLEKLLEKKP